MRRNALLLLCLLLVSLAPTGAIAASFDCERAIARVEKVICGTPSLSQLDSQLATVFKTALTAVAPSSKQALLTEQRNWINHTRDICQDAACMEEAYLKRIDVLARNERYIVDKPSCEIPDGNSCRSVVVLRDPNSRLQSFDQSMSDRNIDGKIIGCKKLIDLPVGTADGNHSFGGDCVLESHSKRTDVRICRDLMLGRFAIEPFERRRERDHDLIEFTNQRCFGG